MAYVSTAFTRTLAGTVVLLLCGAAMAADTGAGSRTDGPSVNTPATDSTPANNIKRCNAVLLSPHAFENDLLELCKLLRSLTKPHRLPPVEFT